MTHSCVEIYIHVIFATKNREPLIPLELENRLYAYIGGISRQKKSVLLNINGTENHVHLLIQLHSTVDVSTLVKEIKSYSTAWIKKEGFHYFSWQEGYGAFSYSKSQLPSLIGYIQNQKIHHQTHSFEDEIKILNENWQTKWILS